MCFSDAKFPRCLIVATYVPVCTAPYPTSMQSSRVQDFGTEGQCILDAVDLLANGRILLMWILKKKGLEVVDCIHLAQGMTTNGQAWAG